MAIPSAFAARYGGGSPASGGSSAGGAGGLPSAFSARYSDGGAGTPAAFSPAAQLSPVESKVLNSFMSLPQTERNLSLSRLQSAANNGDTGAARKLQLLQPHLKQNTPQESSFGPAPTFSNKILNAASDWATQNIAAPVLRGGKALTSLQNTGQLGESGKQFGADVVNTGLNFVPVGKGAKLAESGAKFGAKLLEGAKTGAAIGAVGSGASAVGSGAKPLDIAKATGEGAVTGGVFGGGGAGVAHLAGTAIKSASRFINVPVERVAHARVAATQPELYRNGSEKEVQAAVTKEINSIKADPTQKQAIAQAYHQGGVKGLTAETGYHPDAVRVAKAAQQTDAIFQDSVKGLAEKLGESAVGGPPKSVARIHEKATNDYGGDVSRVQDATRASITMSNPNKLDSMIKAIGEQYPIERVKPASDTGFYRDTKVNVKLPSGHTGEIILASPEMLAAKEAVHPAYEQLRSKNSLSPDEVKSLTDQTDQTFSDALNAEASRLKSAGVTSRPSTKALAGENGLPSGVSPETLPRESATSLTGTSSTSKNLGNVERSDISASPSAFNVSRSGENVNLPGQNGKEAAVKSLDELRSMPKEDLTPTERQKLFGKPIAQNVDETLSTPDATSRVKQYEQSLQDTIAGIEKAPGYQAELSAKGGGEVISNKETYAKAKAAGPLDNTTIKNWQAGEPVDSVTLVRAKATLNSEAQTFTDRWQSGGLSSEELDGAAKELAQLEAGYHVMSAEPGRATQIQSTFIDKEYQKAQALKKLVEETKGPNKEALIKKGLDDFSKAAEGQEKSGLLSAATAKRFTDMLAEYATAAKLTSPLTHAINVASNLLTLPQRAAENVVSAGWGTLTGRTSLSQAKYVFGTSQGLKNATAQFGRDLAQAVNPKAADLGLEGGKGEVEPAIPGVAGKVIRTPFNLLNAADNFFKTMLRDSELHQQAFAKAFQEGHTGAALSSRVEELVKSPTPELQSRADKVAKEFTFQAEPGPLAEGIAQILGKVPLMRLLIPFVSTPVNIAKFQIQRTPLGIFAPRNIKELTTGGVDRSDAVARLAVGTGMSAAGVAAVLNAGENIVGAAPTNPGEKDNFYNSGKKPYSIKIGNSWVQYNRFQPVGMYLTQAVNLCDALTSGNSKTAGNIFTSMAVGTAKGIADLPFVSGVNNVITALNDPTNQSNANKAIGGLLTGLIPNVSRDIASYGDNVQRSAKTITDQVKLMIPGFVPGFNRNQVTPRQATFGGTEANAGTPLQRGFLKIVSPDQSNRVTKTLDNIGQNTGYYPQSPSAKTKVRGKVLSPSDFQKYQELAGKNLGSELQKALRDAAFTGADPEEQQRQLQGMVSDSREGAATTLFGKAPKIHPTKLKHYNK